MKLTNSQYNLIMNEYSEQRFQNAHQLDERVLEVYEKLPRIKEINDTISTLSLKCAREIMGKSSAEADLLKKKLNEDINSLSKEKSYLLHMYGFPANYLELQYKCDQCKDTGYIGTTQCQCLKNKIIATLYQQSNISEILKKENFSTFSTEHYSKTTIDPVLGCSPYENIMDVLATCKSFVHNFDTEFNNLYLYGEVGVGKTFLSNCIANELIASGHSVIYLPAIKLFDMLSSERFGKSDDSTEKSGISSYLYDCDLLIIDDLGTELINSFTTSELFNCINERNLLRKSTVISSNLSLIQLKDIYAERIFSRLTTFTILKVVGEDIRLKISLS